MKPYCLSVCCGFPWLILDSFNSEAVSETRLSRLIEWKRQNNCMRGRLYYEFSYYYAAVRP